MHLSSFENMKKSVKEFFDREDGKVLDVGSLDVNGCYKPIFTNGQFQYTGIDLEKGPNVDVVISNPYRYPFKSNNFDLVISGQAFEHIEYFWMTMLEMARVTNIGGFIIIIAPSRGPEHRYPKDCWRFYPDGYHALASFSGLELIHVHADWNKHYDPESSEWGDCIGVFQKKENNFKQQILKKLLNYLIK